MRPSLRPVCIAGTGACAPKQVLSNAELAQRVDTDDAWIVSRTGIRERRVAGPGETCSELGAGAAKHALEMAGLDAHQVDCIVVATITPDTVFPSTAAYIQRLLGCDRTAGFDLSAACSGFVYGLTVASSLVAAGTYDNVLLVGAEVMTSITDPLDRNTCILFGDGAGACLLRPAAKGEPSEILHSILRVECDDQVLVVPAGGSNLPASHDTVEARQHYMKMQGRATFRFAVTSFKSLFEETLEAAGITQERLRWIVPHQVNQRIIEAAAKRTGFPTERIAVNLDRFGNTSAAGIPMCLDELVREGKLERGDHVLFVAFGAGLTWGSVLVRW